VNNYVAFKLTGMSALPARSRRIALNNFQIQYKRLRLEDQNVGLK